PRAAAEAVEPAARGGLGGSGLHALEPGEVDELLADLQLPVEPALLGEVAHDPLRGRPHGLLPEADRPGVRRGDVGDHPDQRGLPGAVGAEEAEDPARLGRERDGVHGRDGRAALAVALGDAVDDENGHTDGSGGEMTEASAMHRPALSGERAGGWRDAAAGLNGAAATPARRW